ncbi:MAG: sugar phosphate isomerase/epimerase family protein [Pirellulaceae bacterium]
MQHIKIGLELASLRQPFKQALHTAAQLGAQAVEIDARNEIFSADLSQTALRALRKTLEDLNLRVCAVSFHTRRGYDVLEDLDRRVAATKKALQLAYQLRASVVVNQVGTVPREPQGQAWDLLLETLTDLGRHGERVGAFLAAETGTESGADLKRLVDALPSGFVAVDLNPGKLIVNGFSAQEAAEQLGPHILHVHASDGVRDLARGRGIEVPLGQGDAEFPELLGVLENYAYRGSLTVQSRSGDDPTADISQAIKYLKHLG